MVYCGGSRDKQSPGLFIDSDKLLPALLHRCAHFHSKKHRRSGAFSVFFYLCFWFFFLYFGCCVLFSMRGEALRLPHAGKPKPCCYPVWKQVLLATCQGRRTFSCVERQGLFLAKHFSDFSSRQPACSCKSRHLPLLVKRSADATRRKSSRSSRRPPRRLLRVAWLALVRSTGRQVIGK